VPSKPGPGTRSTGTVVPELLVPVLLVAAGGAVVVPVGSVVAVVEALADVVALVVAVVLGVAMLPVGGTVTVVLVGLVVPPAAAS
jgi:hypothetical protein